jgi:hypothetical protein
MTSPIYEKKAGEAFDNDSVSKKKYKSEGNMTTFPFGIVTGKCYIKVSCAVPCEEKCKMNSWSS